MALLALGLGEPLLCILHCQIILPIAFHDYFAAQRHHEHQHTHLHVAAASPGESSADTASTTAAISSAPLDALVCAFRNGSGDGSVPFHVPPSPVHDMIPALMLLLLVAPLIHAGFAVAARHPPEICLPPPLRPPILLAV